MLLCLINRPDRRPWTCIRQADLGIVRMNGLEAADKLLAIGLLAFLDEAGDESRIALLRKLIQLEPGREDVYDWLAETCERSGDRAGARQALAMKERMLLEES